MTQSNLSAAVSKGAVTLSLVLLASACSTAPMQATGAATAPSMSTKPVFSQVTLADAVKVPAWQRYDMMMLPFGCASAFVVQ